MTDQPEENRMDEELSAYDSETLTLLHRQALDRADAIGEERSRRAFSEAALALYIQLRRFDRLMAPDLQDVTELRRLCRSVIEHPYLSRPARYHYYGPNQQEDD